MAKRKPQQPDAEDVAEQAASYHEHKPAEPTSVCEAKDIPAIDSRYSRPSLHSEGEPGASDPVNPPSPATMPEHVSMVAWATPHPDTAQHYPEVEAEGEPEPPPPDTPPA